MTGMITDTASLSAAVIEYLARDQDATLIARVPWFFQSFEAKMNRSLFFRKMEQRSTAQTDPNAAEPEYIALPADFQSMRRIRIVGGAQTGIPFLEYKSNQQMDEYKACNITSGQPKYFTIFGDEIELGPSPDGIYTLEMVYRQNLPSLNANSTNWLLTLAPDLYLYGSLLEATPYIKKDERIQVWGTFLASALSDLNDLGKTSQFNAGPLIVAPSGRRP
jgi:hypothetical protein